MRISIIGAGYVGLVTGACLAELGHEVTAVDVDPSKVDRINNGEAPFHEPGLDELLKRVVGAGLFATLDLDSAVLTSDVTFIAAPTPFDGRQIDLRFIRQIAAQIGSALAQKSSYHLVVVKSTVVPGTTDDVVKPILESESRKRCGPDFGLGMNPEFLSEGSAIEDFRRPDRIVIGGCDERAIRTLAGVYESFTSVPAVPTNNRTAEMIKYASNALQATMISFANDFANLCTAVGGVDVVDVLKGVHLMKELNAGGKPASITNFLGAGCGFGGSCFPKDLGAIAAHARQAGAAMPVIEAVLEVNRGQPARMIAPLLRQFGSIKGLRVAVLGLAFKPGTDDMRESPAIPVVHHLIEGGAEVRAYDPVAGDIARRVFAGKSVNVVDSLDAAIEGVQAVLLVTRWVEFASLPQKLAEMNPSPLLVDGRRMIDKTSVPRYAGVGLGTGGRR